MIRVLVSNPEKYEKFWKHRQALRNGSNDEKILSLSIPVILLERIKQNAMIILRNGAIAIEVMRNSPIARFDD
jgi:hypothetical protein